MYAIIDEQNRFHGTYTTEAAAQAAAKKYAVQYPGITIHVLKSVWCCGNNEQPKLPPGDFDWHMV